MTKYISRTSESNLLSYLNLTKIIAVVGARQVGKTTLIKEKITSLPKRSINYVTLDSPEALLLFNENIEEFFKQYVETYDLVIIDEIQYGKNAGSKLKYLADVKTATFVVSSSSQSLLKKEVLSFLPGRVTLLYLHSFSVDEFLLSKNIKTKHWDFVRPQLGEHIIYGGYPKVVITKEYMLKKKVLTDLITVCLQKDIVLTFGLDDEIEAFKLLKMLASQTGQILDIAALSRDSGIQYDRLKKYLNAFTLSGIISLVQPFNRNKRTELVKSPKIFFNDTGFCNCLLKRYDIDGPLFETYIFSELIKAGYDVKYWRTKAKAEVDFVLETEKGLIAIEVKKGAPKASKSLYSFIKKYSPAKSYVVSLNVEKSEENGIFKVNPITMLDLLKKFLSADYI